MLIRDMLVKSFLILLTIFSCFIVNDTALSGKDNGNLSDNDSIHIKNFGKVDNCYFRGGRPTDSDIMTLHQLGVRTIINLREPYRKSDMVRQKVIANNLGMNYYNIPMIQPTPPNEEQINQFFSILFNPDNLPVYVHCRSGKDRTGIMTALYRVRCYNWSFDQAYSEMKSYGYHRFLFLEQKHFLYRYAKNLGTS